MNTMLIWALQLAAVGCFVALGEARAQTTERVYLVRGLDGRVADDLVQANLTFTVVGDVHMEFSVANRYSSVENLELFVANESLALTRITLKPGSRECNLTVYRAPYMVAKREKRDCLSESTKGAKGGWAGAVTLAAGDLPDQPSRYNMAAKQLPITPQSGPTAHHEPHILSLYTLVNAPISVPDLMVVDRYKVIGAKY